MPKGRHGWLKASQLVTNRVARTKTITHIAGVVNRCRNLAWRGGPVTIAMPERLRVGSAGATYVGELGMLLYKTQRKGFRDVDGRPAVVSVVMASLSASSSLNGLSSQVMYG
eukprot:3163835-Amphidinium_carterae.1